jgi:hypothetical protein
LGLAVRGARFEVMTDSSKPVERLFPFVLRSRILIVGRETLWRLRGKLHFILITTDTSANSREEILKGFADYPVIEHYVSADLERFFGLRGTKVIGFRKSALAQSIYSELKDYRIQKPALPIPPRRRVEKAEAAVSKVNAPRGHQA